LRFRAQSIKSVAINITQGEIAVEPQQQEQLAAGEKLTAYWELTKPRITFLIVLTAAAGFFMGTRGQVDYLGFFHALFGIAMLSSGIAALNQFMERDLDRLMRRTAVRPLPEGRLSPAEALLFGAGLTIIAELYLAVLVNPLTAVLGIGVIAGYLFMYTPLKTKTTLSTVVGAFPGAMPPLLGWTAASNQLDAGAWVLFAILLLWQFPHFLAIAWMYREDYARAGIVMLPVVEPEGHITARQIVLYTTTLIPVSLMPTLIGIAGRVYFAGALILGLLFLFSSIVAAVAKTKQRARQLLLASVLYLPLLFVLMVFNSL
jgi:protoheme IX farnesyltransferase